jgi:hypothetical protein
MIFEPGEYVWKNKDTDIPVMVTAFLGKGPDGRDYVQIEGSTTGVPWDECTKKEVKKSKLISYSKRPKRSRIN